MLLGFLVVVAVNRGVGVVFDHERAAEVLLGDEFAPDLHDLLIEVPSVHDLAFLLEDLSHVEVAAA